MSEVTFLVLKVSAKGACVTTTCEILGNSVPVEAFVAPVSAYATGIKLSDSLTKVVTLLFFVLDAWVCSRRTSISRRSQSEINGVS